MLTQAGLYNFISRLEDQIAYWENAQRREIATFGVSCVDHRTFETKIRRKSHLRQRTQAFADSMRIVASRDVTLPKACLVARARHFRREYDNLTVPEHTTALETDIDEKIFERLQAEFTVAYTTLMIELLFSNLATTNNARSGQTRIQDEKSRDIQDSEVDAPAALDFQNRLAEDATIEKPLAYRELLTHGDGLFLGWTGQKLDKDADKYLQQKYKQGKYKPGRNSFYYSIGHDSEGHCLTIAPTGSGKGVGVIIPNLLYYKGSIIVIDPKGENYHVTARFRRELGQRVVLLDPFDEIPASTGGADRGSLNPFDFMSADPQRAEEEAQMIAELLAEGGSDGDKFWDSSAKGLLAGLIHNLATSSVIPTHRRHFGTLIEQIYNTNLWASRVHDGHLSLKIHDQPLSAFARMQIDNAVSADAAGTAKNIIQFVTSYLHALSGQNVIESMKTSSLSVEEVVKDDKGGFTIYLVIPPSKLASHAKLLALWISSLMGAVMTRKEPVRRRTLFLLDECAQLGTLPQLRSAVTLLRGYGLQTWMFFQDLSQLERLYPSDYHTIINNCAVLQTFGHSRLTAVSAIAGVIAGYQPEDLLALSREQQIISITGARPLACYRGNYRTDGAFEGRFDHNPRFPKPILPPL